MLKVISIPSVHFFFVVVGECVSFLHSTPILYHSPAFCCSSTEEKKAVFLSGRMIHSFLPESVYTNRP